MRRILAVLPVLLALAGGAPPQRAAAQSAEPAAVPVSPEVLAQGGSFTANAEGFQALFHNLAAPGQAAAGEQALELTVAESRCYSARASAGR
jgi:hypothetical protein